MEPREDSTGQVTEASPRRTSGWRRAAPVATLLILAPVVSEVLFGATRISVIAVLIPQIAIWGCGTLLIRYGVRRWRRGWLSLLLLGIALAVAEECIIQQTSLAPLVGLASHEYGRLWGVNWVYFLWALGYESVWVVVLPVQLTELIFRDRRGELWIGRRVLVLACAAFVLGSLVAWYTWTQVARTKVFHMPEYQPPLVYLFLALAIILLLFAAAFCPWTLPRSTRPAFSGLAPRPWIVGLAAFLLGAPWCALVLLAFGAVPTIPVAIPVIAGLAWALTAFALMMRWTNCSAWNDLHRFAVVLGGVLACMMAGFVVFAVGGALPIDWVGKSVLDVIAAGLLARLGHRLEHQARLGPNGTSLPIAIGNGQ